jgi:5-methyltetrahydropteroyltriglutamate--homocysteine methyltransferase
MVRFGGNGLLCVARPGRVAFCGNCDRRLEHRSAGLLWLWLDLAVLGRQGGGVPIPTEPVGSIPRPLELIEAVRAAAAGQISGEELERLYVQAVRETIASLEATGSPVISDGEQRKPSFLTYPLAGLEGLAPDGVVIPFEDGHTRQLPRLTRGPFRYQRYADVYLEEAQRYASRPLKQAVIAASALSLLYPQEGIEDYPREAFLADLLAEAEADIRRSLERGAHRVQIDFTEARLSLKLDPSAQLLRDFVELNNTVLRRFSPGQRQRIGVHTCPGGDLDSTHSADVDYSSLLPTLFELEAGSFFVQLASEKNPRTVLETVQAHLKPGQLFFVGVINPIDARVETPEEVRDRVLEAAEYIPLAQLGTTDDCGFSPFGDDTSTPRTIAFDKIRARVRGTELAAQQLAT